MTKNRQPLVTIIVLLFIIFNSWPPPLVAAEPSPTATPSAAPAGETKTKQIEDLKERLATKVAELRTLQRRAIYGKVKTVSITSAAIETLTRDVKIELPDEIRVIQYLKGKRTTLSTENIAKDDIVTVFGDYDATLDLLKAKIVFIETPQSLTRLAGQVKEVNKTNFTITLVTDEGRTYIIDIEKSTKTNLWEEGLGLVKSGFSKISVGDTLHISGTPVPKKEDRVNAVRLLDLGNLSGEVVTSSPTPTTTLEATPTATPKASPTAKPTATPTP